MKARTKRKAILVTAAAVIFVGFILAAPRTKAETLKKPQPITPTESTTTATAEPTLDLSLLRKIENVKQTHYDVCKACCGKSPDHPAYGITASGRKAEPYLSVAVDPDVIPLGSLILVEYEDGTVQQYRADDTGSGVKGAHIDLCVTDHDEALNLGKKTVTVYWAEDDMVDNYTLWQLYEAKQEKEMAHLPKCTCCDEPIQDDICYEIDGEVICADCLKDNYQRRTSDYIDNRA